MIGMRKAAVATACAALVSGCGSVREVRNDIEAQVPVARKAIESPVALAESPRVVERKGTRLAATEVVYQKNAGAWLKSKQVELRATNPMTLAQIVAKFAANGINITSDLPLDNMTFVGVVNTTDAESALRQVLGSSGLDYEVDDKRKIVTIKPLSSRTWYLNLGNRRSTYASNGTAGNTTGTNPSGGSNSGQAAAQAGGMATSQQIGGAYAGATNNQQGNVSSSTISAQGSSSAGSNGTGVTANEDYWGALDRELSKRLTVMVPVAKTIAGRPMAAGGLPALPVAASGLPMQLNQPPVPMAGPSMGGASSTDPSAAGSNELYALKKIGTHSLNPETGAITVQAPHWVLSELDVYFRRTADAFNTLFSFEGVLMRVSGTRSDSEGFDIQHFASWAAGRYGAIVSNNALGGVTVNFGPGNIPIVSAGAQQVGGPLVGVASPADGLQIFNAYMQERGDTAIVQRPRLATTSGVPGKYSNIIKDFYTTISQTAAAGNTGAATQATNNVLTPIEFGTDLKIYPRYDIATGLVRANIELRSVVSAGEKTITQFINAGTTALQVPQRIPRPHELNTSGEVLLRDGDLILVGGQTEDSLQVDENGLPGSNGPMGGFFGTKTATRSGGTYYFALKVSVNKR